MEQPTALCARVVDSTPLLRLKLVVDGASTHPCSGGCGYEVWVAPSTREYMAQQENGKNAAYLCSKCAAKALRDGSATNDELGRAPLGETELSPGLNEYADQLTAFLRVLEPEQMADFLEGTDV